jgi:hypothetical protein
MYLNSLALSYYYSVSGFDLQCKRILREDSKSRLFGVKSLDVTMSVSKKVHNFDMAVVKGYAFLKRFSFQEPSLSLVGRNKSICLMKVSLSSKPVITVFLTRFMNYLRKYSGFYLSKVYMGGGVQSNFSVSDYMVFSNELGLTYDYFNWRYPALVTFSYDGNPGFEYFFWNSIFNRAALNYSVRM